MAEPLLTIPPEAVGVRLARINRKGELILCESVRFTQGATAVNTTLRRAWVSGRVEVGGKIADHFADLLNEAGDIIETVALDARSYSSLKNRWMRCRVEPSHG